MNTGNKDYTCILFAAMGGQVILANVMEVEMVYAIPANVFPGIRFLCANA